MARPGEGDRFHGPVRICRTAAPAIAQLWHNPFMRTYPECLPCLLSNAVNMARQVSAEETVVQNVLEETIRLKPFHGGVWDTFTAVTTMHTWAALTALVGDPDPLAAKKRSQNEAALSMLPHARRHVADSADPLLTALKLCILGNVFDTMVGPLVDPGPHLLAELGAMPLDGTSLQEFRRRLDAASSIVYLADNCGEVVFDLLFLETLKRSHEVDVVLVARQVPTINDATVAEAVAVGLGSVARVIGNGDPRPLPSTDLASCSDELTGLIAKADLVISKGGANYELLSEESAPTGRITYLLHGKCRPLCTVHGVPLGGLIVSNG